MSASVLKLDIASDHPAFAGHFPGMPIVPGVVLLDEAMHALALALRLPDSALAVTAAKFLSPVAPGEALLLEYEEGRPGELRLEILAGERRVASASLRYA